MSGGEAIADGEKLPPGLAALAGEAAAIDAGTHGQAPAAPGGQVQAAPGAGVVSVDAQVAHDNAMALGSALAMLRAITAAPVLWNPPLRTLEVRMTDDVIDRVVGPWGVAFASSGINLGKYAGGPWGHAIMTTGPLLWSIAQALLDELAERKRNRQREAAPVAVRADDPARPE